MHIKILLGEATRHTASVDQGCVYNDTFTTTGIRRELRYRHIVRKLRNTHKYKALVLLFCRLHRQHPHHPITILKNISILTIKYQVIHTNNILHFLNRTRRNYSRIPTDQLLSPPEHCAWLRRGHASGGSILYL